MKHKYTLSARGLFLKKRAFIFLFVVLAVSMIVFPFVPRARCSTTLTRQVGADLDDCLAEYTTSWQFWTSGIYEQNVGYTTDVAKMGGGMRWTNIAIPKGATISSAYLQICAGDTFVQNTVRSRISGHDVDNSATFSDAANFWDRYNNSRTSAIVDWDAIPTWSADTWYNSTDIKSVIQEITSRTGWTSGNALTLFWEDFDDRSDHAMLRKRGGYDYGGSSTKAPKLVITYEEPDATPPTYTLPSPSYNTTASGQPCLLSCQWFDGVAVSMVFQSNNASGSWSYNNTVTLSSSWANFTVTLPSAGTVMGYYWIANDTANNWNVTMPIQTLTTTDATPPTYTLPSPSYNTTASGQPCLLSCQWFDGVAVSMVFQSNNASGSWSYNNTVTLSSGWANFTVTLPSAGIVVGYYWIANDTSNNWNVSMAIQTLITTASGWGKVFLAVPNAKISEIMAVPVTQISKVDGVP